MENIIAKEFLEECIIKTIKSIFIKKPNLNDLKIGINIDEKIINNENGVIVTINVKYLWVGERKNINKVNDRHEIDCGSSKFTKNDLIIAKKHINVKEIINKIYEEPA